MRAIWIGIGLVVVAANFPGWATFLLWAAVACPLLALVGHLRSRRWC